MHPSVEQTMYSPSARLRVTFNQRGSICVSCPRLRVAIERSGASITTASSLYWRVTYTSTNANQENSSSVCVENIGATITADGTVSFP